jgi:DnaJ-domain-containing protein 1
MGVFDRLGDVIKSYLNDEDENIFGRTRRERQRGGDPDLDAAFDELNDFLGKDSAQRDGWRGIVDEEPGDSAAGDSSYHKGGYGADKSGGAGRTGSGTAPAALRQDFAELGLDLGAPAEDCKAAYKKLLKIHHPDRHAGHPGNMKKATDKSARINAAYDRIEKGRTTGQI